jgi:hypothetical protein
LQVPLATQELDTEGSALGIVDDAGAWDGFIEMVVEETAPD